MSLDIMDKVQTILNRLFIFSLFARISVLFRYSLTKTNKALYANLLVFLSSLVIIGGCKLQDTNSEFVIKEHINFPSSWEIVEESDEKVILHIPRGQDGEAQILILNISDNPTGDSNSQILSKRMDTIIETTASDTMPIDIETPYVETINNYEVTRASLTYYQVIFIQRKHMAIFSKDNNLILIDAMGTGTVPQNTVEELLLHLN
jgi:hypothetical protein